MIGRVVKSHGIRGEVSVEITTDNPDQRFYEGVVLHGKQTQKIMDLTIESMRMHQNRLLIKFEEIPDRTAADSLRGMQFWAEPLYDEEDDGFYDHELEGLIVYEDKDGQRIKHGHITGVIHGPAGELLEVEKTDGKEALIPFKIEIVPEVNCEEGYILITPPEGLLDL